jgi:outer membrane autotransporter protein
MKIRKQARLHSVLVATAGLFVVPVAQADLTNVPGMTPVQAPTAEAIMTFCPPLNQLDRSLTEQEALLARSCTKMVHTAISQQTGSSLPLDIGLSVSGMRELLQAVAAEEMNAQSRPRTVTTGAPINARLLALRRSAGGGALAGSTWDINGQTFALSDLLPAGSRGGGASADAALGGPWSVFVNGHYNWGKRDASLLENAFKFDDYGFVAGADYRFSETTVAGAALNYSRTKADFRRGLGDVKSRDLGISAYASYTRDNLYVDGFVGFSRIDFDTARRIFAASTTGVEGFDTTAKGSTDADQITASIGTGYDWTRDDLTVTPFARLNYLHLKVDGFREKEPVHALGLDVRSRSVTSLQSALGAQIAKAISLESGVITPYVGVEWNHEFRNKSRNIVAKYTHDPFNTFFAIPTEKPDRNYYTVRAGVTSVYPSGVSAFANVDTVVGLRDTRSTSVTVGVRVEF